MNEWTRQSDWVVIDGKRYKGVDQVGCGGCAFQEPGTGCVDAPHCNRHDRDDGRTLIFKEVHLMDEIKVGDRIKYRNETVEVVTRVLPVLDSPFYKWQVFTDKSTGWFLSEDGYLFEGRETSHDVVGIL